MDPQNFAEILALTPLGDDIFEGRNPANGWKRVFGGQVLGHALAAASATVEGRECHSLHAYFLLGGDPAEPILYEVERLRDGGSFSTRRVQAKQHGKVIYSTIASFQAPETGFEHTTPMPDVPMPEDLPDEEALASKLPPAMRRLIDRSWPVEMRPVNLERYIHQDRPFKTNGIWIRARHPLPADASPVLHRCALAFASDYSLLEAGLMGHGYLIMDKRLQAASLDHALWFHRPFRVDEWLLFWQDSPTAQGGRALTRGSFFNMNGDLVASVAQEGLVRVRAAAA